MGRTRTSIAVVFVGIVFLGIMGCDGSSPPEQSGTQLLAGRDFGNLFFWNEQTPAFTRQTAAPGASSQDLWVWPDGESAPLLALSQIDWSPPASSARARAGDILLTGPSANKVYNLELRSSLDLETVAAQGKPGAQGITWASVRRDGGSVVAHLGTGDLFAGRGSTFTFMPSPYVAWGADFMGNDLAVLASPSLSDVDQLIYRMALPSGDLSLLPVASLGSTVLGCFSLEVPPCQTFRVLGCGADDAACPETGRPPCAILYLRADAMTQVAHPYVLDVGTGQETALPGDDPSAFVVSPDRHSAAWMHSDIADTGNGTMPPDQQPIYVHNFCSGAAVQCPLPHPVQVSWRGDGGELVVDLNDNQLAVVDVATGSCSVLDGNVRQHAFSPAGNQLAWIGDEGATVSPAPITLWMRDAAAGGQRLVAYDVPAFRFSPDGQRIFIIHSDSDHFSLSWVSSMASNSQHQQPIADSYSGVALRGNQRVLVIDHWNSQDASGNLELVDIASGRQQVLAHAVTGVAASGSIDGAARVMYAVRGRFASGQDGLWQTMLPAP